MLWKSKKKLKKIFFFDFFKINFRAIYGTQTLSTCVWDPKVSPDGSFLNHFKTILSNFLKIDSGTYGKPIFVSALRKRFENAQNKRFWSFVFSKNKVNSGLSEAPLLVGATQGDNKKIRRIFFWLKPYFLKKSILNVPSG